MPRYTSDQRQQAREHYEARGASYAAKQTGITRRTISEWARSEGWTRRLATTFDDPEGHREATRLGWHVRKRGLADDAGRVAAAMLAMLERRIAVGKVYGIRELSIGFAAIVDKADMLAPPVGVEGLEPRSDAEISQRVGELVHAWQQRQQAAGGDG